MHATLSECEKQRGYGYVSAYCNAGSAKGLGNCAYRNADSAEGLDKCAYRYVCWGLRLVCISQHVSNYEAKCNA